MLLLLDTNHRDDGMMKFALRAFMVWIRIESVVRVCFSFSIQVGRDKE